MGSIIVNYYRKKAPEDPFIPNVRVPHSFSRLDSPSHVRPH